MWRICGKTCWRLMIGLLLWSAAILSQPTIVTWNENHSYCSFVLPGHQHLTSYQYLKREGSWSFKYGNQSSKSNKATKNTRTSRPTLQSSHFIRCTPHPYYLYFQNILRKLKELPEKSSTMTWYEDVAKEIVQLYVLLPSRLQPLVLSTDYIRQYLSEHYNSHQSQPLQFPSKTVEIYPFYFGLLPDNFRRYASVKNKTFGRVIPGTRSTYYSFVEEALYQEDISVSQFIFTWKKAGWDCLRHYEILAHGSLPIFTDIADAPPDVLSVHPKPLYQLLLKTPGLSVSFSKGKKHGTGRTYEVGGLRYTPPDNSQERVPIDQTQFLYHASEAMLYYGQQTMTTTSYAKFLLATVKKTMLKDYPYLLPNTSDALARWPRSIFYITHKNAWDMDQGDYGTDFLLNGLYDIVGNFQYESYLDERNVQRYRNVRGIVDFPSRDCLFKRDAHFQTTTFLKQRENYYGMGYSYGLHRETLSHVIDRNITLLKDVLSNDRTLSTVQASSSSSYPTNLFDIDASSFDLIVLGSAHREWMSKLYLWDDFVCKYAHRGKVVMLDADDVPLSRGRLQKYLPCVAHVFAREGYKM